MIRNIQMVIDESVSGYQRPRHFIVFKSFGIQQPASEPTRSQAHQKRDSENHPSRPWPNGPRYKTVSNLRGSCHLYRVIVSRSALLLDENHLRALCFELVTKRANF